VGSDSKNGVRHQRALSPRLSMMMMKKVVESAVVLSIITKSPAVARVARPYRL